MIEREKVGWTSGEKASVRSGSRVLLGQEDKSALEVWLRILEQSGALAV